MKLDAIPCWPLKRKPQISFRCSTSTKTTKQKQINPPKINQTNKNKTFSPTSLTENPKSPSSPSSVSNTC